MIAKSLSTKATGHRRVKDPVKFAFKQLCAGVNSPLAQRLGGLSDLGKSREPMPDPTLYQNASSFADDYLLVSFLSKYKGLNTGINTERAALASFAAAEDRCRIVNARFRHTKPTFVDPLLLRAQRIVQKVLGFPTFSKLDGLERWGPGATSDLRRNRAYLDDKIAKLPLSVTAEALPFFKRAIETDLHWSELILGVFPSGEFSLLPCVFAITQGSRIVTVDKNAKTDRTIAIEPRGNMFLQKSVGNYIRRRLKRFGIDLDNQGRNQDLARQGLELKLATIDLSMASDSMCQLLIYELLPLDWAAYLDKIRSHFYYLGDEVKRFEKFSSMGNGFTFELESLLFYALAKASMENEESPMSVYGDDIIVPCSDAHTTIMLLSYCGFETNVDKTYVDGPFRESCGKHYFNGVDVTPIYQKELVLDLSSHIRFLNRLIRHAAKRGDGDRICKILSPIWSRLYSDVSNGWHPRIPLGTEGDDGYVVTHGACIRLPKYDRNYGYRWDVIRRRVKSLPANDRALLAYALRLGCVTEAPYGGNVDSLDTEAVDYTRSTRWIEPSWEFALGL